jgi:Homeodomain-like domain
VPRPGETVPEAKRAARELKRKVLADKARCLTDDQIADRHGCSERTVRRILKWRDDQALARMAEVRAREMQNQLAQNNWWKSEMAAEHLRSKEPVTRVIETEEDGQPVRKTEVVERLANPAYAQAYRGLSADNRSLLRLDHQAISDDKDLEEAELIDDLDNQAAIVTSDQDKQSAQGETEAGVQGVPE